MTELDPRILALYDIDNPGGPDHDYFRSLAGTVRTIVDLGCGTGILTVTLSGGNRRVIGIDPSEGMLAIARVRPGNERVTWILGDSRAIGNVAADLAIMTGNVVQHILGDEWPRTLRDIHRGLAPGATLAFECRNPTAAAWTRWPDKHNPRSRHTEFGPLIHWTEINSIDSRGNVHYAAHYIFSRTDEHLKYQRTLAFRTAEDITHELKSAGFHVQNIWGGWRRGPVDITSKVLVFQAIRAEEPDGGE